MADDITKTGIWIDTAKNEIVTKQPVEGVLVLRPGSDITPDIQADLDAFAVAKVEAAKPDPAPDVPVANALTVTESAPKATKSK